MGVQCALSERAVYGLCVRGFENALTDAALRPDFCEELVSRVAAHQMDMVERLLQIAVDGIMSGDDAEVARLCREMGRGGGYILSGSKYLQPKTPTENAAAVVESFLEQAGVSIPLFPF